MRLYLLSIIAIMLSFHALGQSKFSQEAVLEDFETLHKSLEEAHCNLYAYTAKEVFDSTYAVLRHTIQQDSLTLLEAINIFQRLVSVIDNGHTWINFPVQSYFDYAQKGGTLFPLEVALEDDKALIRRNWSGNESIDIGAEVLSINKVPIAKILAKIYPQISAERLYFKNAKVELFTFPRYYWQVFGEQSDFAVEIRIDEEVKTYSLDAVSVMEGYETKRADILNFERKLTFVDTSAYLNPGGFDGDESEYRAFIDSAFVEINAKKSENLIIDLRNNPGGGDAFSDYLVSYIADKSFRWNAKFLLKTSRLLKEDIRQNKDTTQVYWQTALSHPDGEIYNYDFGEYEPQAKEKRFKGRVYVLVNRHSYSQSTVTAAQIQDYDFGTIVGEETGEYPTLYASIFSYPLPNTAIPVNISKGYMVRVNGSEKEEGVIPDILIKDHLVDENDEILEGVLRIINER